METNQLITISKPIIEQVNATSIELKGKNLSFPMWCVRMRNALSEASLLDDVKTLWTALFVITQAQKEALFGDMNDRLTAVPQGIKDDLQGALQIITLNSADFVSYMTKTAATVDFSVDGGSAESDIETYVGLTVTLPTPTKAGYYFVGWYESTSYTTPFTNETVIAADDTAYALWSLIPVITTTNPLGNLTLDESTTERIISANTSVTWSIVDGALPTGMTFDTLTGTDITLGGTPTVLETTFFTLRATEATYGQYVEKTFDIDVKAMALVTDTILDNGTVDVAYTTTIVANGGTAPYTYALEDDLPTGLTLTAATGVIAGTPTVAETKVFTIRATDDGGLTDANIYSITIDAA